MKGLALLMTAKKPSSKEPDGDEPMGDEEEGTSADEYKAVMADAAKAGDWDAFADAVAGLVSCSK